MSEQDRTDAPDGRPGVMDAARRRIHPFTARASLALRVALLTTGAVAAVLAVASATVYITVRAELEDSLDASLIKRADAAVAAGYSPSTMSTADTVSLGEEKTSQRTARIAGVPYRIVAVQAGPGQALVLAQSMESTQRSLERLKVILLLTSAVGILVAGVAGWVVATNGLRPVRRLTAATERVARTAQLEPIEVTGSEHDELARLTSSFNQMMLALDASQQRQRQLVADAGHELRTPLTSLRTNIELLGQATERSDRELSIEQRREIMDDVRAQLGELTTLVGDLVELARDEPLHRAPEPLDLVDVVEQAVERVRPRAGGLVLDVRLEHWDVIGEAHVLERAVTNLLDNAVKWSPEGGTVTVRLRDGVLTVRDEGPGIAAEDLPHVFERFFRSTEARTMPGSGLGLSIVHQAAVRHGGSVRAESPPSGGTVVTFELPAADASPA